MILELGLGAAGFVAYEGYKAYKNGTFKKYVTALEARVTALETAAKAEVTKVVTAVETDINKVV